MSTVPLSNSFQLQVPESVREALHLRGGERFQVVSYDGRLEFIPIRQPSEIRGFVRGMDPTICRDDEDRV